MSYPYSLDDYVAEVYSFMERERILGASVIAHSFGGRIAIRLSAKDKGVFDKIVLTGSAGLKPRRNLKYRIKKATFLILKKFIKRERLKKFYSKDYNALSPVMQESFKKIISCHLDGEAKNIENETLIINGKKDRETPPYMAKRLKKYIKSSKLVFIKDAGHFAFIDRPKTFNETVKEFLLKGI